VGQQDVELGVQVGRVWLELEDEDVIEQVEEASRRILPRLVYTNAPDAD
jgi:methyl coenzyme M reductase subunit D